MFWRMNIQPPKQRFFYMPLGGCFHLDCIEFLIKISDIYNHSQRKHLIAIPIQTIVTTTITIIGVKIFSVDRPREVAFIS